MTEPSGAKAQSVDADILTQFWAKVDCSGGPDACWPWRGVHNSDGWGAFKLPSKKTITPHKFAYMLHHGALSNRVLLRHSCGRRDCCNPAHIILANPTAVLERDDADNADDVDDVDDAHDVTLWTPESDLRPLDADVFPDALFERALFEPSEAYLREQLASLTDSMRHALAWSAVTDYEHARCVIMVYGRWIRFSPARERWFILQRGAWRPVHPYYVCRVVQLMLRLRLLVTEEQSDVEPTVTRRLRHFLRDLHHLQMTVRLAEPFVHDGSQPQREDDDY